MTRLSVTKSQEKIAPLEDEFSLLRTSYRVTEVALKTAIDLLPADETLRLLGQFHPYLDV